MNDTNNNACKNEGNADETGKAILFSEIAKSKFVSFAKEIQNSENYTPIPTGEKHIDDFINGGFTRGKLTTLYGAPAIGKTAFCQQIAEGIAAHGTPVIYFNFEMDDVSLYARSISRIAISEINRYIEFYQILRYGNQDQQTQDRIREAEKIYFEKIAPNIIYNPDPPVSNSDETVKRSRTDLTVVEGTIRNYVDYVKRSSGDGKQTPVVVIDYIQLVDAGKREDAEQTKAVLNKLNELKTELNIAIIAISASNRESNKSGTVEIESGRGTSNLEYSGDTILGLSYTAIEDEEQIDGKKIDYNYIRKAKERARKERKPELYECSRKICLKLLKSRYGESDTRLELFFDAPRYRFLSWKDYKDPERAKRENISLLPEYENVKVTDDVLIY